jgi:hypothetical protein
MKRSLTVAALLGVAAIFAMSDEIIAQTTRPSFPPREPIVMPDPAPYAIPNADSTATDALGRTLPDYAEVGGPKAGRYVGIFYWHWHHDNRWWRYYDMTNYLRDHPRQWEFTPTPEGGPNNQTFYWAEPIFGYYRSTDRWVIRKHLVMLADAGVDFLWLDYTNSSVYDDALLALLEVSRELKAAGVNVPRITFFLNHQPDWKLYHLYTKWYCDPQWDEFWFRWKGKPLMMSPPVDATKLRDGQDPAIVPQVNAYFTIRPTWAYRRADNEPGLWRFVHTADAPLVRNPQTGEPEQLVVSKSTGGPIHKAFSEGGVNSVPGVTKVDADYDDGWNLPGMEKGIFFDASWKHAHDVANDPATAFPILLVTGWNEWTASVWGGHEGLNWLGRIKNSAEKGHMVDEFNQTFNRDIEPMRGGYFDAYYWQFVGHMRRYKGMQPPQPVSPARPISGSTPLAGWDDVTPVFRDAPNDTANRDHDGVAPPEAQTREVATWDERKKLPLIHYVNTTAHNDIAEARVARDEATVAFHVRCAKPIDFTTPNPLWLLVDVDDDPKTGWNGYDLLVRRDAKSGEHTLLRYAGGNGEWKWDGVQSVKSASDGTDLVLHLPRSLFPAGPLKFGFKWADAQPDEPSMESFYTDGDVAPNTRLRFRFVEPIATR